MAGQFKNFIHQENQNVWDQFAEHRYNSAFEKAKLKIKETDKMTPSGKAQQNVNAHKPVVLELERMIKYTFETMTVEDIEATIKSKPANKAQLNAFLLFVVGNGLIKVSNDVIIKLVPSEYKDLVKLLVK